MTGIEEERHPRKGLWYKIEDPFKREEFSGVGEHIGWMWIPEANGKKTLPVFRTIKDYLFTHVADATVELTTKP